MMKLFVLMLMGVSLSTGAFAALKLERIKISKTNLQRLNQGLLVPKTGLEKQTNNCYHMCMAGASGRNLTLEQGIAWEDNCMGKCYNSFQ